MPRIAMLLTWLVVALAMLVVPVAAPAAAQPEWSEGRTEHLVLRFRPADAAEVIWYEQFLEDVYREVCDVFGEQPRTGIVVTFHPDEASYAAVNPLAGREESILAHASPSTGEIGLAIWRLRPLPEAQRRDAVRHELTHVVLGDMTGNRLPIGLHEGIAQYMERDTAQRMKMVRTLRRAADVDQLLSFQDLNRQRTFLGRAGIAYPQSYSVVAFLNDRYGFGHVIDLVGAFREGASPDDAARRTFGRSLAELEDEWQAYLPGYLDGGWARNDLDLWEMARPRALLVDRKYGEAKEEFERAARLFEGIERPEKLEQARYGLQQSEAGLEAVDLSQRGSSALETHDYQTAVELLGRAETLWAFVGDQARQDAVTSGVEQARLGVTARGQLESAHAELEAWRLPEARAGALAAGRAFAELADETRIAEANAVLAEAQELQTQFGMAAFGAGAVGLVVAGAAWGMARRRREQKPGAPSPALGLAARESDWSL
jgi:hypothetical protein